MQDIRIADESLEGSGAWTIEDPDTYRFLTSRESPRSGSFPQALKVDIRSRRVIQYWAKGLGLFALGATGVYFGVKSDSWMRGVPGLYAAFMGGRVLYAMLRLFLAFVRQLRLGPVLRGRIPSLGRSSPIRGISMVHARLPDGRKLLVALEIAPALALLGGEAPAEVLILADPAETGGMVIGIRPISGDRAGAEGPRPSE